MDRSQALGYDPAMGLAVKLRRFELVSAESNKFWEVWTRGTFLMVRYGRMGTQGTTKVKRHPSVDDAIAAADKLVAQKLRKGYRDPKAGTAAKTETAKTKTGRTRTKASSDLAKLWKRLESIAGAHGRSLMLRDGASAKEVAAAEKKFGREFPTDYRESMSLHDGQQQNAEAFAFLPGCSLLSPLSAIVEFHTSLLELAEEYPPEADEFGPEGMIHLAVFHADRIPLAGYPYWDGDNTYIDFANGPKGTSGQLITMFTESDFVRLGSGIGDALEAFVTALDSGAWIYDATLGRVVPKGHKRRSYGNTAYAFAKYRRGQRP